jgi:hypothetical protein
MLRVEGGGQPAHLRKKADHHAYHALPLIGPLEGTVLGILGRGDAEHRVVIFKAGATNIHLANGRRIALRPNRTAQSILVYQSNGSFRSAARRQIMQIASQDDVWRFGAWLRRTAS